MFAWVCFRLRSWGFWGDSLRHVLVSRGDAEGEERDQ